MSPFVDHSAHYAQQRSHMRTHMHAAAEVRLPEQHRDHIGLLRDVSSRGIYFYSDFKPAIGCQLVVVFTLRKSGASTTVYCEGKVVRVDQVARGAAPGIALRLLKQPMVLDGCTTPSSALPRTRISS